MAAVLTSWKEIAAHLGKSIRTVQRWERELNLPVRRPDARRSGIVLADPAELDAWLHHQHTLGPLPEADHGNAEVKAAVTVVGRHPEALANLYARSEAAVQRSQSLYQKLSENVERLRNGLANSRRISASTRQLTAARSDSPPQDLRNTARAILSRLQ